MTEILQNVTQQTNVFHFFNWHSEVRVHVAEAPGLLAARRADLRVEPPEERAEDFLGLPKEAIYFFILENE